MKLDDLRPPLLQLQAVSKSYRLPRRQLWQAPAFLHALQGVDLKVYSGRNLGIVGESGSGTACHGTGYPQQRPGAVGRS